MARPARFRPYIEFEPPSGGTERIYGDITMSEDFSSPAQITEFMVETGSRLNDHYLIQPKKFRLEILVTGSPVHAPDDSYAEEQSTIQLEIPEYPKPAFGVGSLTQGALSAVGLGRSNEGPPRKATVRKITPDPSNRAREVLDLLLQIQASRTLITVATRYVRVDDLGIGEIRFVRSGPDDGDGLKISIDCTQMTFGEAETADAVVLPAAPIAHKKKGGANSAASGAPVPEEQQSALSKILDTIRGQ